MMTVMMMMLFDCHSSEKPSHRTDDRRTGMSRRQIALASVVFLSVR